MKQLYTQAGITGGGTQLVRNRGPFLFDMGLLTACGDRRERE